MTNKDLKERIAKLEEDRKIYLPMAIIFGVLFILMVALGADTAQDYHSYKVCGDEDYKITVVYANNDARNAVIGNQCCADIENQYFDEERGTWTKEEYKDCFYIAKNETKTR